MLIGGVATRISILGPLIDMLWNGIWEWDMRHSRSYIRHVRSTMISVEQLIPVNGRLIDTLLRVCVAMATNVCF